MTVIRRPRYLIFASLTAALLLAAPVGATTSETDCQEPACYLDQARVLLKAGDARDAVELLKKGIASFPDHGEIAVLLGVSYLRAGNDFWAIRTLTRRLAEHPEDCEARAWLAWLHMGQANLAETQDLLSDHGCEGPEGGRLDMIQASLAGLEGDSGAATAALRKARKATSLFPGDRRELGGLAGRVLPDGMPELSWRIEVVQGYTTNALLGSPTDPTSGSVLDGGSAFGQVDLWLRFAPWLHDMVRPLAEVQVKGIGFVASEVRGVSWMDLSGRVGIVVGRTVPRLLLAWRPDWLFLAQGDRYDDGPLLYFSAHRGEFELEVASWLLVFGGGGHRTFREWSRTRYEADLGLGGRVDLAKPLALIWAATARVYRANDPAWNLWGGSVLLSLQGRLPLGFMIRGGMSASLDAYPDSHGYELFGFPDRDRMDVFLKPGISAWFPSLAGVRFGIHYDFSWRNSTAPAYDFQDHRATIRMTWGGSTDVLLPGTARTGPIADIPWIGSGGDGDTDRVQDLLRQDEQVQRSSSCVQ